jgi:hypothetical protein
MDARVKRWQVEIPGEWIASNGEPEGVLTTPCVPHSELG